MRGKRLRRRLAALTTLFIFTVLFLSWLPFSQDSKGQDPKKKGRKPRPEDTAVQMSSDVVQLQINLGLKDKKGQPWTGSIQVANGKLQSLKIQAGGKATTKGNTFKGASFTQKKKPKKMVRPKLFLTVTDAQPDTKITVNSNNGMFEFTLAEVPDNKIKKLWQGQASVQVDPAAVLLTGSYAEEDYPAMVHGEADSQVWLV